MYSWKLFGTSRQAGGFLDNKKSRDNAAAQQKSTEKNYGAFGASAGVSAPSVAAGCGGVGEG